jgi:hypothetical protein
MLCYLRDPISLYFRHALTLAKIYFEPKSQIILVLQNLLNYLNYLYLLVDEFKDEQDEDSSSSSGSGSGSNSESESE